MEKIKAYVLIFLFPALSLFLFLVSPSITMELPFFVLIARAVEYFYILPAEALQNLFQIPGQTPGLADRFLIMCGGFVLFTMFFTFCSQLIHVFLKPPPLDRHKKAHGLWLWVGQILFSQIEFILSYQRGLNQLRQKPLILISAVGFITLDLPGLSRYTIYTQTSLWVLIVWKSLAVATVCLVVDFIPKNNESRNPSPEKKKWLPTGVFVAIWCCSALMVVGALVRILAIPVEATFFSGDPSSMGNSSKMSFIIWRGFIIHEAEAYRLLRTLLLPAPHAKVMSFWLLSFINMTSFGLQLGAFLALSLRPWQQCLRVVIYGMVIATVAHVLLTLPIGLTLCL